jgi:hypothetical protein
MADHMSSEHLIGCVGMRKSGLYRLIMRSKIGSPEAGPRYSSPLQGGGETPPPYRKGAAKHSIHIAGGKQSMAVVPEADLYRLIMRSKLPSAERFEKGIKRIANLGGPQNTSIIIISAPALSTQRPRTPLK